MSTYSAKYLAVNNFVFQYDSVLAYLVCNIHSVEKAFYTFSAT